MNLWAAAPLRLTPSRICMLQIVPLLWYGKSGRKPRTYQFGITVFVKFRDFHRFHFVKR